MEWQPIETAPRDGTAIDLWVVSDLTGAWREANAYWVVGRMAPGPEFGSPRDGWFAPGYDWDGADGFFEEGCRATHWRPLPDPPTDTIAARITTDNERA